MDVCEHALIPCGNVSFCGGSNNEGVFEDAEEKKCLKYFLRKDIKKHEKEMCSIRRVKCHSCEGPLSLNLLQVYLKSRALVPLVIHNQHYSLLWLVVF